MKTVVLNNALNLGMQDNRRRLYTQRVSMMYKKTKCNLLMKTLTDRTGAKHRPQQSMVVDYCKENAIFQL
jgi:hypothetical protein